MDIEEKNSFVADIERRHGRSLRRFLASRLRNAAADLPDLVQEVFLRLLRVEHHECIRNPEGYLITIASHVLHQHTLRETAKPDSIDAMEALVGWEADAASDPVVQAQIGQRIAQLEDQLQRLSPKARTVLILHRRDGLPLEVIGAQLGISRAMAKKYLAKALAHCRKRLPRAE